MNLGFGEILVILVLALLLFGGKRLPEIGRSLGTALKEFRKALDPEEKRTDVAEPIAGSEKTGEDEPRR